MHILDMLLQFSFHTMVFFLLKHFYWCKFGATNINVVISHSCLPLPCLALSFYIKMVIDSWMDTVFSSMRTLRKSKLLIITCKEKSSMSAHLPRHFQSSSGTHSSPISCLFCHSCNLSNT